MTDQPENASMDPEHTESAATSEPESKAETQADASANNTVKRGGLIVLLIIVLSLTWYLSADRYTPSTDQARVQGYVVGVAPQVSGVVTEVWVKNNQLVEAEERLFQVDTEQYDISLARAKADMENAERQVDAGGASVDAARANLRAAQAGLVKAEKDTQRLTRLREKDSGTISIRRLEQSQASLDQARSKVTAAEADIERAIEQSGGGEGEDNTILKTAITAVEQAELELYRTVVRASTQGVITDLHTEIGLYAAAGNPVMTLVAMKDVWVRAEFTENNLGHMRAGVPVEIIFDALPGNIYQGKISSIGLGISAGKTSPPGTLPEINNNRDWLRQSQRFPVNVSFDIGQDKILNDQLRVGGQATVIAYSEDATILKWLGKFYIRVLSLLSYAY
ncbi:MAG: HlyD family secretion protein [Pseudomonadales bacterium]